MLTLRAPPRTRNASSGITAMTIVWARPVSVKKLAKTVLLLTPTTRRAPDLDSYSRIWGSERPGNARAGRRRRNREISAGEPPILDAYDGERSGDHPARLPRPSRARCHGDAGAGRHHRRRRADPRHPAERRRAAARRGHRRGEPAGHRRPRQRPPPLARALPEGALRQSAARAVDELCPAFRAAAADRAPCLSADPYRCDRGA